MLLAIFSHVKCQWKVCYNKLKQGNFQKTDVGGESHDHFCLRYLGNSQKHGDNRTVYLH